MRRVFVDTSGWFAHLVSEDLSHPVAKGLFDEAVEQEWSLVTTDDVVMETQALLVNRARNGAGLALGFLEDIEAGMATMVHVTAEDFANAVALVRAHRDKTWSLCDASSFVVMDRLGLQDAIAFDRHFRQYGRITIAR